MRKSKVMLTILAAAMAATMLPSMAFADEKPTVTLLVPEYNAGKSLKNEGSDQVIQMVEDYTGFNFDIKWGDNGAYDQVIGTTLMDFDNMPMIITCGGSMNGTIVSAAEEGAFWDLSEYLDDSEKFPNLCWEYGFILRYTADKESITGITDEPWHFRYVGKEVSMDMKDSGLCLEEYLGAESVTMQKVRALFGEKLYEETIYGKDEEKAEETKATEETKAPKETTTKETTPKAA